MANTMITKDGWIYSEIYAIDTCNSTIVVYKVEPKTRNTDDAYFVVTCGRYRASYIEEHTAKELLYRLMPQYYECKCDSEVLAVTIARNIAYESLVLMYRRQMNAIEESFKRLHDRSRDMIKSLEDNYPAALDKFWDEQNRE